MPKTITLPGVDDETHVEINYLAKQLEAKAPRNRLRTAYYDGKNAVKRVGTVIPPQYYKVATTMGWVGRGVDALAQRCNVDEFVWADGDLASLGMRELWDANRLGSEIDQSFISSLTHSTAFAINTTGGENEPRGLIHFKDALSATGEWDSRKRVLSSALSVTAREKDEIAEFTLYRHNATVSAALVDGAWEWEPRSHAWGMPVEPLAHKPRLGRWAGSSRITRAAMQLQDQGVLAVVRLEGHMDVYAWPDWWLLGAEPEMFTNADGSQRSPFEIMLGRIKAVPDREAGSDFNQHDRVDVQHFPASSPEPHLARLNAAAKGFAREMALPDSSVALSDLANPTSEGSYVASREDLIAAAESANSDWTVPLQRTVTRALAMQNGESAIPSAWSSIAPKFRNPIFLSRAQEADAGSKQLAAAPWLAETRVGLELLGLSTQQIDRAMSERRTVRGRARVDALLAPGDDDRG